MSAFGGIEQDCCGTSSGLIQGKCGPGGYWVFIKLDFGLGHFMTWSLRPFGNS